MPTVPTLETESIRSAPIRAPLQQVQGAGVDVSGLVQGLNVAGDAIERGKLQVEEIELQEADAALESAWNEVLSTGKDPYYERVGKNAYESEEGTIKTLTDTASQLSSGLQTGRQRRVFNNSVAKRLQDHKIKIGRHAWEQRQVWDVNSAQAGITSWLESASVDPSRLEEAEVRIGELVGVIQEKQFGVPSGSEMAEQAVFTALSTLYLTTLIGELERGNVSSATSMLEERTEQMSQNDRLKARSAIDAFNNKQETASKVAVNEISVAIDGLAATYDMGIVPDDEEQIKLIVNAMPDSPQKEQLQVEMNNALRFKEQKVVFANLSPNEKDEAMRQLRNNAGSNSQTALLLEDFARIDGVHDALINEDPFLYYINQRNGGKLPSAISTIPNANAGFIGSAERQQLVNEAREFYGPGVEVLPFTDDEMEGLIENYEEGTAATKTQIVGQIQSTMPDEAVDVFAELNRKGANVMSGVGGMFLEGRPDVANRITRGEEAIRTEPELLPPKIDYVGSLDDLLGDAYGRGTEVRQTIERMIMSNYAGYAATPGSGVVSGVLDEDTLEQAIIDVTGGIIEHRGITMPVPRRDRDQDDFDDWFDFGLSTADFEGIDGYTPEQALELVKGDENQARLVMRGPGVYAIAWLSPNPQVGSDGEVSFKRADGSEFLIEYQDTEVLADTEIGENQLRAL